jgi:hypothetical protein
MPTPHSPFFACSLIYSLICLLRPYSVTTIVSSTMPNSIPSPLHRAYTFFSRAHTPPNKTVKLSVLYIQSMTSCVFSYFRLVYHLIFQSNRFPYFALHYTHPDYSSLHVFGCLCYSNPASTMSHKLEPRSSSCVFLGYSPLHKGYCCMDLATKRILISCHVVFDESTFHFASLQAPSTATYKFLDDVQSIVVPPMPRTPLRCRPHRSSCRRPRNRLRRRMRPHWCASLCITCAAPPAYMSLPVSGLTCMLLSKGTRRFPPLHMRHSRIPTSLRL